MHDFIVYLLLLLLFLLFDEYKRRKEMSTQGEQILQQLGKYENFKRGNNDIINSSNIKIEGNEDELLNSQIEMMQLTTSNGTITKGETRIETVKTNKQEQEQQQQQQGGVEKEKQKHYTSLRILESEPKYFPPLNFGVVESDLYRCGHPQNINFPFLKSLKLRTIIYVGDKTNDWEYYKWIKQQNNLQFIHLPIDIINNEGINDSNNNNDNNDNNNDSNNNNLNCLLSIVSYKENYPILIHSNKGKHRVGVVVALIRKIQQQWVLAAIYDEYGKYAKHGKDNSELQFIEFWSREQIT